MDLIFFLVRYTPFWAIPCFMISVRFGYIYWLKAFRGVSFSFAAIAMFSFVMCVYYYWAGGPDKSVDILTHIYLK